jgi:hypothetical protein
MPHQHAHMDKVKQITKSDEYFIIGVKKNFFTLTKTKFTSLAQLVNKFHRKRII